jgi:hypothetical protein
MNVSDAVLPVASAAEEQATAAEEISQAAARLERLISFFRFENALTSGL